MFKNVTIVCLFISISRLAICQISVSGIVKGSGGDTLESCSVLLLEKTDSSIVAFSITNSSGIFEFVIDSVQLNNKILSFSYLGYLSKYVDLSDMKDYKNIQVKLQPDGQMVDEIIISEKQYVSQRGDTLTYHLDNFRDSTEHNIGQLLNKLPGVEVNYKGDIKVMGQAVYNVTIDGDDLTGKRYQLITNSLSALAVQKVDIVYNYIENKLLSDIFESSAVSVNLVTDEQYQMKWNAAVSLGGSHINYDMQFSPIGLFKKMKIIGDVSGNNIGKGMFGLSDFNNSFITPLFISEVIDDKIDTRYSNFERDISRINEKGAANTSILYKINSNSKLKLNYDLGLERFSKTNSTNFLLTNDQILRRDNFTTKSQISQYAVAAKWENHISENSYLDIFVQSSKHIYQHTDMGTSFVVHDNNQKNDNLITATYMYKPYKHILWISNIRLISSKSASTFINNFEPAYINLLEANIDSTYQQTSIPYQDLQLSQTLLRKFNTGIMHVAAGIKGRWINPSIEVDYPIGYHFERSMQAYQEYYTLFKYDWALSKGLKLGFSTQPGLFITDPFVNENNRSQNTYINADINLKYKFNKKWNLNLRTYANDLTGSDYLITNRTLMTNRFNFVRNNSFLPVNKMLGVDFNIVHETVFPLQKFYIQSQAKKHKLKIIDQIFTNPLSVFQETNKVYYPYGIISYHISTGYERLIDPLSSTIKLKANFEENVGKNILNSIIWDVSNRNINITFYLRTGFNFPVNFITGWESGFYYFTSRQVSDPLQELKSRSLQNLFFYDLLLNIKKVTIKWSNSTYISENIVGSRNTNTLSDFEIKIPLKRGKYFTEINMFNVYNTVFKRNFYNYEYLQIDDFIMQRGRHFVLTLRFNI